jgi:hypothetical protein
MYVQLAQHSSSGFLTAEVLAIEHCGSSQNVHDKRSRYQPAVGSLLLKLPRRWLVERSESRQRRGRRRGGQLRETWDAIYGAFQSRPSSDQYAAVTRLRLFLFVPDDDLEQLSRAVSLESHEYLLPHTALDHQYDPRLVELLEHAFHPRMW